MATSRWRRKVEPTNGATRPILVPASRPRRRGKVVVWVAALFALMLAAWAGLRTVVGEESRSSLGRGAERTRERLSEVPVMLRMEDGARVHPKRVRIPLGADIQLVIRNDSAAIHHFIVESLGIHEDIAPEKRVSTALRLKRPGTFRSVCVTPGHEESVTLVVA